MQSSSENPKSPEGFSAENDEGRYAGWNIPKPETIPSPTYWPFVLSLGATLLGLGILTSKIIGAAGTALFILAATKWIGEICNEDRR